VKVLVVRTLREVGERAAVLVARPLLIKANSNVALPTGKTPRYMYKRLVDFCKTGLVDFAEARFFSLDELLGLERGDPRLFSAQLRREFWEHLDLRSGQIYTLNSLPPDPEGECLRYEEAIRCTGGLDLAILGLGINGHIAFNEPGTPWESLTHVATCRPKRGLY